jgi:leucyl aminopeptidase
MPQTLLAPAVALVRSPLAEIDSDLLIVMVFEGEGLSPDLRSIDAATGGAVARALESGEVRGRAGEYFLTPLSGWRAARVALVGAGKPAEFSTERLRRAATAAALGARQRRVRRIAWVQRGGLPAAAAVQAAVEGLLLAAFSSDQYKSGERSGPPAEQLLVVVPPTAGPELEAALERGRVLGECSNLARELCNEPSNVLTPSVLAERAAAICDGAGLTMDVLDEAADRGPGHGAAPRPWRGAAPSRPASSSSATTRRARPRAPSSGWSARA